MNNQNTFKLIIGIFCTLSLIVFYLFVFTPGIVFADNLSMTAVITTGSGGGSRPTAADVVLNAGAPITLSEGLMYNLVLCNFTVTDAEGCNDIVAGDANLYRTGVGSSCTSDPNNCYPGASYCERLEDTCTGGEDLDAEYECRFFNVAYFAEPTDTGAVYESDDWTCGAYGIDSVGAGDPVSDTEEMNTLKAIEITGTLNFPTLRQGEDTGSSPLSDYFENIGNCAVDVEVSSEGWTCATGVIPAGNIKYSDATFTYGSGGTAVTGSAVPVEMDLPKPIVSRNEDPVTDDMYWGLAAPTDALGYCQGSILITAISD